MRRIGALLRTLTVYDLTRLRRRPRILILALAPPAAMALFIWVLTLNVTSEPVALVIGESTDAGERMLEILVSDTDAYRLRVCNAAQAEAALQRQQVAAIITIPAGFAQAVQRHQGRLLLDLNNVDLDFSDDIRRSLDRSVGTFDGLPLERDDDDDAPAVADLPVQAMISLARAASAQPPPAQDNRYLLGIEEHDRRATDTSFLAYELVPVLIYLLLHVAVVAVAMLTAGEVGSGMERAWDATPRPRLLALVARILAGSTIALVTGVCCLVACRLLHLGITAIPHPLVVGTTLTLTALCAGMFGAALGGLRASERSLTLGAMVLTTALFLLGGAFCTPDSLPPVLQRLSTLDPVRGAIDALRQGLFYQRTDGLERDLLAPVAFPLLAIVALALDARRRRVLATPSGRT